jgi:glycosyl transferase family 2
MRHRAIADATEVDAHTLANNDAAVPAQIGVVIPAYNCAAELRRALDSLMAQTYRNFTFVVVDDSSTDDLAGVVAPYAAFGMCVRQPHAGSAAARNRALRLLQTPYIAFLDADDEWLPAKLERQFAFMQAHAEFALTCTDFAQSGMGASFPSHFSGIEPPQSGRVFQRLVRDCFVSTPTVMVRREALDAVGTFHEPLMVSQDYNLWLRVAALFPIGVLPEVLAVRHLRPESVSISTSIERRLSFGVIGLEHVLSKCGQLSPTERRALQHEICNRYESYGGYLLSGHDRERGRVALRRALRYRRFAWRPAAKLAAGFLPPRLYWRLRAWWHRARQVSPA